MRTTTFVSERISKTASITINGNAATVFPLFGAYEEQKWAEGWDPVPVYPGDKKIEAGTTFITGGYDPHEAEFTWVVSRYEPEVHLIQYLVFTANRYWTITVECQSNTSDKTEATITYCYTGLTPVGNEMNRITLARMYQFNLQDWEKAINYFLTTGKCLST